MLNPNSHKPLLSVGIDWADEEHAAWWVTSDNAAKQSETIRQDPQALADWVQSLRQRFPDHRILIALEQSRGPLFNGLASFPELELYPINPKQLARYRESLYPSGSKSDPNDARLLAEFLKHALPRLRRWRPDSVLTRQIGELAELRRKLVDERKRLVLQLHASLKAYFPQLEDLFKRPLQHELMLDLLRRWPTLDDLQRAHPKMLRKFLVDHGVGQTEKQTELIQAVRASRSLTKDEAVVKPRSMYAQNLAQQIRNLNQGIADFDEQLHKLTPQHDDHETFRSLPGAGDALEPRLIAAFGDDRDRYDSAEQVQSRCGIAPVTKQSGKSVEVEKRFLCSTFLRQTFHEFADHARRWSDWSKAFYTMKRAQGMKHHAAVRALAYKWIRIIYRLWQDRTTYSEEQYIARLKKAHSPIVEFLAN